MPSPPHPRVEALLELLALGPDTDRLEVWPLQDLSGEGECTVDALLLKVPEAAAQLGISRAELYELIAAGTVPSVKVGGCRRIRVPPADRPDLLTLASGAC